MARYTGPITKKSRRLKVDLVGGDVAFERRPYAPGQHGRNRVKESERTLITVHFYYTHLIDHYTTT